MFILSKETAMYFEFPAFSDMFILSQGRAQEVQAVSLIKNMEELLQWDKKSHYRSSCIFSQRKRSALLLISVIHGVQKNSFQQRDHRAHIKCQNI